MPRQTISDDVVSLLQRDTSAKIFLYLVLFTKQYTALVTQILILDTFKLDMCSTIPTKRVDHDLPPTFKY